MTWPEEGRLVRRAAFLDRDGVLNQDTGYIGSIERFRWIPGAIEAVSLLQQRGYLVFVVTNQAGVARGFFDEDDVMSVHSHMQRELGLVGTKIDAFRYCPHHPDAVRVEYRMACACRKPSPGLLLDLVNGYGVDKAASFMIGDKESDMQAAAAAGIDGYRFAESSLLAFVEALLAHREVAS